MGASLPSSSRRSGRSRRAPMAEINVTPLVDVMLVLLIIFMVTAPLLVAGVPVDLPESRAGALDQQAEPVQVSIDGDGAIYHRRDRGRPTPQLPGQLARIAAAARARRGPPHLSARRQGLDYGRVMRVMGELNRAGLNRVALVSVGGDAP